MLPQLSSPSVLAPGPLCPVHTPSWMRVIQSTDVGRKVGQELGTLGLLQKGIPPRGTAGKSQGEGDASLPGSVLDRQRPQAGIPEPGERWQGHAFVEGGGHSVMERTSPPYGPARGANSYHNALWGESKTPKVVKWTSSQNGTLYHGHFRSRQRREKPHSWDKRQVIEFGTRGSRAGNRLNNRHSAPHSVRHLSVTRVSPKK